MKSILFTLAIWTFSTSVFANDAYESASLVGESLIQVLRSEEASVEAKQLVNAILNGQSYNTRVSIISHTFAESSDNFYLTIKIGVDDMNDDDLGWSAVYSLKIHQTLDKKSGLFYIHHVTLEPIAG